MARREIEHLRERVDYISGVSRRLEELLPDLEDLVRLRVNLDRLGPRLELIDKIGPRLEEIDKVSAVLRRFLDANHEVSETVRVDVETISALGLQIEKSLAEVLAELRKSNRS